jgi:pimeloyl-ACP methyl ester carboxylesterase
MFNLYGKLAVTAASLTLAFSAPPAPQAVADPVSAADRAAATALKLFTDSELVVRDRISVEVVGSGPDVILIPGLASSRATYRRTAKRLRGKYRLHLVQVAGFAGEPARANATGPVIAPTVSDIDGYIAAAGLKSPAVVGHSIGGLMALMLAADHPDRVGRVMVVDALAFYSELFAGPQATAEGAKPYADAMGAKMLAASDADFAKSAAQTGEFMATAPEDQALIAQWSIKSDRAVMVRAMQEDLVTDLRPRMASISAPVTVLYEAPLDALIKADYAPLKNKTLVMAPAGAKHFIMFDDPKGFDAALDAFLGR